VNKFYHFLDNVYRTLLSKALKYRGVVVYFGFGLLVLVFVTIIASVAGPGMKGSLPKLAGFFVISGLILNWRYKLVGLIATGIGVAGVFLAYSIGAGAGRPLLLFRFAPDQDQATVQILGEMPVGTTLAKTESIVKELEAKVSKFDEVRSMFVFMGASNAGMSGLNAVGPQYFSFTLRLKDKISLLDSIFPNAETKNMRKRQDTIVAQDIRVALGQIPGCTLKVAAVTGFSGGGAPLQIDIQGENIQQLTAIGEQVKKAVKEEPGSLNLDISTRIGQPEMSIDVAREKASSMGMTIAQAGASLRTALEGDDTVVFRQNGYEYKVRVHFTDKDRRDTNAITNMVVATTPGANGVQTPIRLGDIASIRSSTGPTKIDRMNRQKLVSVTANIAPGFAPGNMQAGIEKKLSNISMGTNTWSWGGENKTQGEEGAYMAAALGLSIILVYMLMAALFDNLVYPLVIMLSLPQAMAGALLGLMVAGHALTVVAMIGIIMLVGLVTKNAILLVDYTNTLREEGLSRTEAILQAGPTRLRPILMTTIAMIIGMMPTALGLGRGSEFRAPLATPVIGGLVLSTLLTLLVIPCVYTYFDDMTAFTGRLFGGGRKGRRGKGNDGNGTGPGSSNGKFVAGPAETMEPLVTK